MQTFITLLSIFVLLVLGQSPAISGSPKPSTTVAFTHVNVIPIDRERTEKDQTVLVRDGKIAAIGSSVDVPDDALRIDGTGKYLIPGLADMHVHINSPEDLLCWMAHGVTTLLNLNGTSTLLSWRQKLIDGAMTGPALYTAGPTIYVANTARDGDSLVEAYHSAGYDCIKIYNDVTTDAYDAIIRTAKKYDMLTVGHIPRQPGFERVLKAGMAIAHAEEYIYTILKDSADESRIPELVAATRDAGVTLIATLTAYDHITRQVENLDTILAQPGLKYIPGWVKEDWSPETNRYSAKRGFKLWRLKQRLEFQKRMVAAMQKAGVRVLVGTDAVFNGEVTGESTLKEVENFVAIGISPYNAIKAATRDAAEFLRAGNEFGTIEVGKRADLVLLDANPLEDIRNIEHRSGVMTRGRWYSSEMLQQDMEQLPALFLEQEKNFKNNMEHDIAAALKFENDHDPFDRLLDRELRIIARHGGAEKIKQTLLKIYELQPRSPSVQELTINNFGYELIAGKLMKEAIAVLALNSELFPKSANTFDSLGEAYLDDGEKELAISCYRKALELDPGYESSRKALEKLTKN